MFTLRQITDALCATGPNATDDAERQRIYDRARMLRDKGLILTSQAPSQGKTSLFTEADAAAAVMAIVASLNGNSWGIIQGLNADLRAIGNTLGRAEFERLIGDIKAGIPVLARLDIVARPWGYTTAMMGSAQDVSIEAHPPADGATQVLIWPVTAIAKPVLEKLDGR